MKVNARPEKKLMILQRRSTAPMEFRLFIRRVHMDRFLNDFQRAIRNGWQETDAKRTRWNSRLPSGHPHIVGLSLIILGMPSKSSPISNNTCYAHPRPATISILINLGIKNQVEIRLLLPIAISDKVVTLRYSNLSLTHIIGIEDRPTIGYLLHSQMNLCGLQWVAPFTYATTFPPPPQLNRFGEKWQRMCATAV